MNVLSVAWRNIHRNGRRSLLTLLALAVGSAAILMFGGYVNDTINGLQTSTVRSTGHLQIVPEDYLDFGRGDPARFSIREYSELVDRIRSDPELAPMLAVVTPVLDVEGVAGNFAAGSSSNFFGTGFVPSERGAMLAWDGFGMRIPPSSTRLTDGAADTGVIGVGMAQLLQLCDELELSDCKRMPVVAGAEAASMPDDLAGLTTTTTNSSAGVADQQGVTIELLAASPGGLPNVVRMTVAGAERQAIRQIDHMFVGMPLELAQRMVFGPGEAAASAIIVQLQHTRQLDAASARLTTLIADAGQPLEVLSFRQVSPIYDQIVANYSSIFQFIAWLMGLVALFSIAGAVNMSVSERTGEIGTLRALGFQRGSIRSLFVTEGLLLGLLGSMAGAVLAIIVADIGINMAGLSWTPPGRSTPIPIRSDILATPALVWGTIIVMSIIACLSAAWPARTAARMEVTEALRHA